MNDLKRKLLQIKSNKYDFIRQYEQMYPHDLDLYGMKVDYFLVMGDVEEAFRMAKEAVSKNPYNRDVNIRLRDVYEKMGNEIEALKFDRIAMLIQNLYQIKPEQVSHKIELENHFMCKAAAMEERGVKEEVEELLKIVSCFLKGEESFFGFWDKGIEDMNQLVGTYYEDIYGNKKYNANYNDIYMLDLEENYKKNGNSLVNKIESRQVTEKKCVTVGEDCEYLLPVLSDKADAEYTFVTKEGNRVLCKSKVQNHFNYYRLTPGTRLESENNLYIGKPIPLKQNPELKKLVLNIFVDGLSQKVLDEEGLVNVMPHTAKFFQKGVICGNTYTAGDWTLPSIASYVTGTATIQHHLIHTKLTYHLPGNITLLQEYFKEAGYQTAKIDGDWRSTQVYGYGRGTDRLIYQNQLTGMRAEQVIPDVIDHMELMKETNQFIWMCVGDLHDIADGFELKASVQASVPLELRGDEKDGITSVKQDFSINKRMAYIRQMKHVDEYLNMLYQYIEANYQDQEIIVSMFGDHGQGYLVREEEHFLSQGRSKVGMMFRSDFKPQTVCGELISTCDYVSILCRLAGIPMKGEDTDANLPVFFGGEKEREYTITESIHPGDPYMAAVVSGDGSFYFTSGGKVEYDGRVELGQYRYVMYDSSGMPCNDVAMTDKYLGIVMDHIKEIIIY